MLPVINLGPFALPTGPLLYLLGAWAGLSIVEWAARSQRLSAPVTYGLATTALLAGLVGARLSFVFLHWTAFSQNLLAIIWPLNTGYDVWGGLLVAAAGGFFYGRRHAVPWLRTLDALAPGLLVGLMAVALADFLAGPGYGTETDLPWGLALFGLAVRRHPVQLYEHLVAGLAFLGWWAIRRRDRATGAERPGRPLLVALALFSAGRLFFTPFRANSWITAGGWYGAQLVYFALLGVALLLLQRMAPAGGPSAATGDSVPDQDG